jgi:hypothetical protein
VRSCIGTRLGAARAKPTCLCSPATGFKCAEVASTPQLLSSGEDWFSIPLSLLHTGIGPGPGRGRRDRGRSHIQIGRPSEGGGALLPARAVSRSLATTPTSRPHDRRRVGVAGRRGCLTHAPVRQVGESLPTRGWIACLSLEMGRNGCQAPMNTSAWCTPTLFRPRRCRRGSNSVSADHDFFFACATPQYALTLSNH